jgi:hypothetical protein
MYTMAAATKSRDTIRIGVFIPFGSQLLDMASVDVFGSMSYEYLSEVGELVPAPILELTPSVQIFCTPNLPSSLRSSFPHPNDNN